MRRYDVNEIVVSRYMHRKLSGGRNACARVVDYIMLRVLIWIVACLIFLPRFASRATALLLATITLALCMLLLHMANEIRYATFYKAEIQRIRKRLLQDRLLLLVPQEAIPLISALCPVGTTPVFMQRALPVNANDILMLVRSHTGCEELHIFSCTDYDPTAKAFAARSNGTIVLHAQGELLTAAVEAGMLPDQTDAIRSILSEVALERKHRKQHKSISDYAITGTRKYAIIALLLTMLSFITRFALYYRLLAGFCMTVAAYGAWKKRSEQGSHL